MKASEHLSFAANQVHPYLLTVLPWGQENNCIYQQESASCYVAKVVLEENNEALKLFPWPPNSPNLHPVEDLWNHVDRHIKRMDCEVWSTMQLAWTQIPTATFHGLNTEFVLQWLATVHAGKIIFYLLDKLLQHCE